MNNLLDDIYAQQLNGKTVLIADPTPANRNLFGIYLTKLGANVLYADNGKSAIDLACNGINVDVVSMRPEIAVVSSYDVIRAIDSYHKPKGRSLPVVAVSTRVFESEISAAFDSGFTNFVKIPALREVFIRALAESINGQKLKVYSSERI